MHVLLFTITLFFHQQCLGWNTKPDERRSVDSVIPFKNFLSLDKPLVPKHYLFGNRKEQIIHTRPRVLNYDLYLKNIIDFPLCHCNNIETVKYFFLDWPKNIIYNNQRITLMQTVSSFCAITLGTLLYGNSNLSLQANNDIFETVQHFLKETNIL